MRNRLGGVGLSESGAGLTELFRSTPPASRSTAAAWRCSGGEIGGAGSARSTCKSRLAVEASVEARETLPSLLTFRSDWTGEDRSLPWLWRGPSLTDSSTIEETGEAGDPDEANGAGEMVASREGSDRCDAIEDCCCCCS